METCGTASLGSYRLTWLDHVGRSGWLTGLQVAAAATALIFCFRGEGQPRLWVLLALALPMLRFSLAPTYRQRICAWLRPLWADLPSGPAALQRIPWRAARVLVVLPSAVLFLSNERLIGSGDSWPVVPTACSLVQHGHWELDEYARMVPGCPARADEDIPYCTIRRGGRLYSDYPAGMVPFALPVVVVARLVGADLGSPQVHACLEKWTASWLAALALGLFFLIALHLAEPRAAMTATLLLAGGSAMFSIVGQALWQHGGVVFWILVVLLVEFRSWKRPTPASVLLQGLACGMMLACRLSAVLFIAAFGTWVLFRSPRRAFLLAAASAVAFAPWAWLYGSIYGNCFGPTLCQTDGSNWCWGIGSSLLGVLFSPARGLFVYQPWVLLAAGLCIPAARRTQRQSRLGDCPAGWLWFCVAALVAHLLLVACWRCWWGGWCWGSRLLADVIPLAALLAVGPIAVAWRTSAGRWLLGSLALLSLMAHIPAVYCRADFWNASPEVGEHLERLWSWSEPPLLFPLQHGRDQERIQSSAQHGLLPPGNAYRVYSQSSRSASLPGFAGFAVHPVSVESSPRRRGAALVGV
jgi:hypothetical protein